MGDLGFAKTHNMRIVQRLDGMNWLHKLNPTGWRHYLRSERMNLQLSFIRRWLADTIVYQSTFTRDWWNTEYGSLKKPSHVIHNGVDLETFSPNNKVCIPEDFIRLLVVEGSFKGGHERDLFNAVDAAQQLSDLLDRPVELVVAGNAPQQMRDQVKLERKAGIRWLSIVPHAEIPDLDRSAHLLFPAEINAACPNSVVEALACGLPVVSYATGSIPELVGQDGGITVPYGTNYWKLEAPQTEPLAKAAAQVLENMDKFRASARRRAEENFGLDKMVERYMEVLLG
jgi:glycosyltransferase involved in cell wall biosynthesis